MRAPKLSYLATTTLGQSYAAENKIELAIQTLQEAVEQLEAMRDQVAGSEVESQFFLQNKVASYHYLVDLLVKQDKPLDALLFAERAKGRVLLDVMSSSRADWSKILTPAEKEERQHLNRRISELNDRIKQQQAADSPSLDYLYGQLDSARLNTKPFRMPFM